MAGEEKAKETESLELQRQNLFSLRETADGKRMLLWNGAQNRSKRRKQINVFSGCLALVSGGSAAALLSPVTDLLGLKLATAALAFTSGAISLITNTFFDDKETARMYQGAGSYGELRDRISVVFNKPGLTAKDAYSAFERFTEQSGKLAKDYDQLLDANAMEDLVVSVRAALEEMRTRSQKSISAGEAWAGGGTVFVAPLQVAPSAPSIVYTPIHRD